MFIDVGRLGKTATFLSCAFKRCVHVTAYMCGKKPKIAAVNYCSFLAVHDAERLSLTVGKLYNNLV